MRGRNHLQLPSEIGRVAHRKLGTDRFEAFKGRQANDHCLYWNWRKQEIKREGLTFWSPERRFVSAMALDYEDNSESAVGEKGSVE